MSNPINRKTIYLDDALEAIRKLPNAGIHWLISAEAVFDALLQLPPAQSNLQPTCNNLATDTISRQALCEYALSQKDKSVTPNDIMRFPSAQPTLYGYNVEHLILIAEVLRKENMPPEMVAEALTDIGRIVAIVRDEFEKSFRKAVEQCMT